MAKKGYTPEQIINKLREAEILLSWGETIVVISKQIGVSAHTYYRWRKEYGGMKVDKARRLKELEQENSRLKKQVADLSLDNTTIAFPLPSACPSTGEIAPNHQHLSVFHVVMWASASRRDPHIKP